MQVLETVLCAHCRRPISVRDAVGCACPCQRRLHVVCGNCAARQAADDLHQIVWGDAA